MVNGLITMSRHRQANCSRDPRSAPPISKAGALTDGSPCKASSTKNRSIWLFLLRHRASWAARRAWTTGQGHRPDLAAALAGRSLYMLVLAAGRPLHPLRAVRGHAARRCSTTSSTSIVAAGRRRRSAIRYTRARQMTTQYRWLYERDRPAQLASSRARRPASAPEASHECRCIST